MKFSKGEKLFLFLIFLFGAFIMLLLVTNMQIQVQAPRRPKAVPTQIPSKHWQIQSIDTMKYSRDMARQDENDPVFASDVQQQIADIAATGANYVAIDTPYDAEFLPVLKVWVQEARTYKLHIWFRGNFSGWEGWFGYSKINQSEHLQKTKEFIVANKDLFQDGDIFTSCPECENGAKPNLSTPQSLNAYRQFIIAEYDTTKASFAQINKNVASNFYSMNGDVARAVMDHATTQKLDGVVVIDHYVRTPEDLATQTAAIAAQSGGLIVLGEFGAPIPDIQGNMTEQQQSDWLNQTLRLLTSVHALIGVNYWVNKGGSTALWHVDDTPKPAVAVIKDYYQGIE